MSNYSNITIGVLALQGAVSEHIRQVESLGAKAIAIKTVDELQLVNALILPGGESTAIGKLMRRYGFIEAIQSFAKNHAVFGTCAGMILLAKNISNAEESHLNLVDISVERNAFGRQKESFQVDLDIKGIDVPFPAIFIRAPYVASIDSQDIEILSSVNEHPVLIRQGNILACSFHPELSDDSRLLDFFLSRLVF